MIWWFHGLPQISQLYTLARTWACVLITDPLMLVWTLNKTVQPHHTNLQLSHSQIEGMDKVRKKNLPGCDRSFRGKLNCQVMDWAQVQIRSVQKGTREKLIRGKYKFAKCLKLNRAIKKEVRNASRVLFHRKLLSIPQSSFNIRNCLSVSALQGSNCAVIKPEHSLSSANNNH